MQFCVSVQVGNKTLTKLKDIALHYLCSGGMILDFIGVIPGLVTLEFFPQIYWLKIV